MQDEIDKLSSQILFAKKRRQALQDAIVNKFGFPLLLDIELASYGETNTTFNIENSAVIFKNDEEKSQAEAHFLEFKQRSEEITRLEFEQNELINIRIKTDIQIKAALEDRHIQRLHEELQFWFRRFNITVALANAGTFTAVAAGLAQADKPEQLGKHLGLAMTFFAAGAICGGAVPLPLAFATVLKIRGSDFRFRAHSIPEFFAGALILASATAFIFGLLQLVGLVNGFSN